MTVDEVTFGGDIAAIAAAMKEAVNQVEEHVHDVVPDTSHLGGGGVGLAHRVNDVSLSPLFRRFNVVCRIIIIREIGFISYCNQRLN